MGGRLFASVQAKNASAFFATGVGGGPVTNSKRVSKTGPSFSVKSSIYLWKEPSKIVKKARWLSGRGTKWAKCNVPTESAPSFILPCVARKTSSSSTKAFRLDLMGRESSSGCCSLLPVKSAERAQDLMSETELPAYAE